MASRRLLKKEIKYMTQTVGCMCLIAANKLPNYQEVPTELMYKVFDLRSDIVSRISHTEPGNVKNFYKQLHEDFSKELEEILLKLYELYEMREK